MKRGFYSKLAWTGIRKNKKLYTPYLLTCIGMVMMYYIISFLAGSDVLGNMAGGDTMQSMLLWGCSVMAVFTLIFLFYTNSFLMRRRKKEFGLYNILGMGKWNLARVLLWETLIIAGISLGVGLIAGIVLSKFAELGMANLLFADTTFTMSIQPQAIVQTLLLFAVVFALILLNGLRQIHLSNPIELLHSENTGEKPPKARWILTVLGILILAFAYYLAVSIEDPVAALALFFVAVILVIIATYMLFISGSIALCRMLQKKKKYYYKTNHFVSVSSMVYRMKRNGAGLASICILCTMVLVMVSTTVCLYMGAEDSLRATYPRNINLDTAVSSLEMLDEETSSDMAAVKNIAQETVAQNGQTQQNVLDYRSAAFAGYVTNNRVVVDQSQLYGYQMSMYSNMWQIFVVPLQDYNQVMGKSETLAPGEVMIYTTKGQKYENDTIAIGDGQPMTIKKTVPDFVDNRVNSVQIVPSLYIFVPDFAQTVAPLMGLQDHGMDIVNLNWYYGFDLACGDDMQMQIHSQLEEKLKELGLTYDDDTSFATLCESVAKERAGFYGLYGGLFFLGILLGIVFIFAAVLIMYYKQVSEGYEDRSRFEIMQKVGMTKREIRKSINSQMLTVFFLPLLTAGIHLAFAFPLLSKMLALFNLTNMVLLTLVTLCCYLIFGVFYILVYRVTSKAYYTIVSGAKEERV